MRTYGFSPDNSRALSIARRGFLDALDFLGLVGAVVVVDAVSVVPVVPAVGMVDVVAVVYVVYEPPSGWCWLNTDRTTSTVARLVIDRPLMMPENTVYILRRRYRVYSYPRGGWLAG